MDRARQRYYLVMGRIRRIITDSVQFVFVPVHPTNQNQYRTDLIFISMEYYNKSRSMSAPLLVVSDLQQETDAEIMLYGNNNI